MTTADQVIGYGLAEVGHPYVFGAEGPDNFDCSGLMLFIFGKAGIHLPRTAAEQQSATARTSSPVPGDLVFFGDPATHVGLYLGAGKMLTAPHTGATVHVTDVGNPTNYGRVSGVGSGISPVLGGAQAAISNVGDWLGGARYVVLEFVFGAMGLGLVGYGLYRAVKPGLSGVRKYMEEGL